jgi:ABC-2 type transport system permease protein
MRTLAFLEKTFLENLRDWKILVLTLAFAPCFVYMMKGYFAAATPSYRLLVLQHDEASGDAGGEAANAEGLVAAWQAVRHPDGQPVFVVSKVRNLPAAIALVKRRDAELVVEIPAGFSRRLADRRDGKAGAPARLVNHGDAANVRSSMAMAYSDYVAYLWVAGVTGVSFPLELDVRGVGAGRPLSEFDLYVPALLVLAIIMVMFTAAATLVREVDKGTMIRLRLSPLRTAELLAAVSINQLLIGLVALALTLLAAVSVGYRPQGPWFAVLVVGAVATLGVVALSVGVAAFLKSMFELLTVGCFPFFILMFFSESMFPLPKVTLFHLAGRAFYANDVLPTSLAVRALGRILNFGAGLDDVAFELAAALVLTLGYYVLGAWLFARRHLRVG